MGIQGGYTGWGREGLYRVPSHTARGASPDSEAGPGSPVRGLEWVVRVQRANGGVGGPRYHPAGPVGTPGPSLYLGPWECRLLANRARFKAIS